MPRIKKTQPKLVSFDWVGWLCATLANYAPCARCGCFYVYHKPKSTYMRHKWRIGQTDGMVEVLAKTSCDCDYCMCFCISFIPTIPSQRWKHCLYDPWSEIKPVYEKTSFRVICEYCHNEPCICHVLGRFVDALLLFIFKVYRLKDDPLNVVRNIEPYQTGGMEINVNHGSTTIEITTDQPGGSPESITGDPQVGDGREGPEDTSWFKSPTITGRGKGNRTARKNRK